MTDRELLQEVFADPVIAALRRGIRRRLALCGETLLHARPETGAQALQAFAAEQARSEELHLLFDDPLDYFTSEE